MHYERKDLGFSFDLPDGWRRSEDQPMLSFYGPKGGLGILSELIQIKFTTILPQYLTPASREQFYAEPGAQVSRTRVGDEDNAVVLRRARDSEISLVRDDVHYIIVHFNDEASESAIECLKRTARFPSPQNAQEAIPRLSAPRLIGDDQSTAREDSRTCCADFVRPRPVGGGGFFDRLRVVRIVLLLSGLAALFVMLGPYGIPERVGCGIVFVFIAWQFSLIITPHLTRPQFEGRSFRIRGAVGTHEAAESLRQYLKAQGATVVANSEANADYVVILMDRGGEFQIRFQGPKNSERSFRRGLLGWPTSIALELSSFIRATQQIE